MSNSARERSRLVQLWINELAVKLGTDKGAASDAEIARRMGVGNSAVTRWRQGGGIKLEHLIRMGELSDHSVGDVLMAFYGLSPEELLPTAEVVRANRIVLPDGSSISGRFRMMLVFAEDAR